jgi:hypothetical protein
VTIFFFATVAAVSISSLRLRTASAFSHYDANRLHHQGRQPIIVSVTTRRHAWSPSSTTSTTRLLDTSSGSSRDEEIAKLEEQLKRLKQQQQQDEDEPSTSSFSAVAREKEQDEEEVPIEMFLSEGWKEAEAVRQGDGNGGTLTTILGAVALAIFLAAFSQVPIGQEDLSKVRPSYDDDKDIIVVRSCLHVRVRVCNC